MPHNFENIVCWDCFVFTPKCSPMLHVGMDLGWFSSFRRITHHFWYRHGPFHPAYHTCDALCRYTRGPVQSVRAYRKSLRRAGLHRRTYAYYGRPWIGACRGSFGRGGGGGGTARVISDAPADPLKEPQPPILAGPIRSCPIRVGPRQLVGSGRGNDGAMRDMPVLSSTLGWQKSGGNAKH